MDGPLRNFYFWKKVPLVQFRYLVCAVFGLFSLLADFGRKFELKWRNQPTQCTSQIFLEHWYCPGNSVICIRGHSTTSTEFYSLIVDKKRKFLTPPPPHLVHIVIEWPLMSTLRIQKGLTRFKKFFLIWIPSNI